MEVGAGASAHRDLGNAERGKRGTYLHSVPYSTEASGSDLDAQKSTHMPTVSEFELKPMAVRARPPAGSGLQPTSVQPSGRVELALVYSAVSL